MIQLRKFPGPKEVAEQCGGQILEWLGSALESNANGLASLAVSGGSSPRAMFEMFAAKTFPWDRVHLFWVDERCVPSTDSQSNYKFTFDAWLHQGQFPAANIHRVPTELNPAEAAEAYARDIRDFFRLATGQLPVFDVIHRGMGAEGHTASLFPGEPEIGNRKDIATAVWVEKLNQWRVTTLPGVLESAHHTAMLVVGADKAEALQHVLNGSFNPLQFPAQLARDQAGTVWFVDNAAAGAVES